MRHDDAIVQAHIYESLGNAVDHNGYIENLTGDPHQVAIDLCTYDAFAETLEIEEVERHVRSWQEMRRAQATKH